MLQTLIWSMEEQENWEGSGIEKASREVSEAFGVNHKKVVMALLFGTIMGKKQGPPLFASVEILGKDRTRARLLQAIAFLGGLSKKKTEHLKDLWETRACTSLIKES